MYKCVTSSVFFKKQNQNNSPGILFKNRKKKTHTQLLFTQLHPQYTTIPRIQSIVNKKKKKKTTNIHTIFIYKTQYQNLKTMKSTVHIANTIKVVIAAPRTLLQPSTITPYHRPQPIHNTPNPQPTIIKQDKKKNREKRENNT